MNTPTVTLDKGYYHLQREMISWCEETFKTPAVWLHGRPERFPPDAAWAITLCLAPPTFTLTKKQMPLGLPCVGYEQETSTGTVTTTPHKGYHGLQTKEN